MYLLMAVGFIAAIGVAIFVHELGHFLAAKAYGVPVERFVIGFDKEALPFMPKCIIEKHWRGTDYGLSLVPLGGYVKMAGVVHPDIEAYIDGEDAAKKQASPSGEPASPIEPPAPPAEKRRESLSEQAMGDQAALYKRPFHQKIVIYGAGVVMNFLLAMAVVAFIRAKGSEIDAPLPAVVGWQAEASHALALGFLPGDRIVAIDGEDIETDRDFFLALDARFPTERGAAAEFVLEAEFLVLRAGEEVVVPARFEWAEESHREAIGRMVSRPAHIDYVVRNLPAHRARIMAGDTVVAIDGEPVADWWQFFDAIRSNLGNELRLEVVGRAGGPPRTAVVRPVESTSEPGVGIIGVMPGNPERVFERVPPLEAVTAAPGIIINNIQRYVSHLGKLGKRLVTGDVQAVRQDLGGPVAIAQMAGYHTTLGFDRWLEFVIMLNIALGVMNLLPFPVLDGGHIVFAVYEGIFGKPMPARILVPVLNGGVVFILGFFLLITFSDVLKIIGF